jgi:hypothetical protein
MSEPRLKEAKPAAGTGMTRRSIIVGVGLLAAALIAQAGITLFGTLRKGQSAQITDGDGNIHEIPLNTNERKEITTALGTNTVEVADGQIRIVEASCANKDCIHQGAIGKPGQTIVCLPNRLVIRIEDSSGDDGGGNGEDGGNDGTSPPDVDAVSG